MSQVVDLALEKGTLLWLELQSRLAQSLEDGLKAVELFFEAPRSKLWTASKLRLGDVYPKAPSSPLKPVRKGGFAVALFFFFFFFYENL